VVAIDAPILPAREWISSKQLIQGIDRRQSENEREVLFRLSRARRGGLAWIGRQREH
jgi:hypothetical protein